jgi:hypothetical protein
MKVIVSFLLLLLLLATGAAAAPLTKAAYPGTWAATWTATEGEQQVLTVSQELRAEFYRHLKDGHTQHLFSQKAEIIEDLVVFKFPGETGQLEFKLVLSGWSNNGTEQLYGTFYLYSKGEPFNGFPVMFEKQ